MITVLLAVVQAWGSIYFSVCWQYPNLLSSLVSLRRIEGFLLKEERNAVSYHDNAQLTVPAKRGPPEVVFTKADAGISGLPLLHAVTTTCPAGKLTVVAGKVGCGKTSILNAVLGELDVTGGSVTLSSSGAQIAFCSQDAFLRKSATVRDNILFFRPFDASRYRAVVKACCLDQDLETFEDGDSHSCRSMSGGQCSRVALARAVVSLMYVRKWSSLTLV